MLSVAECEALRRRIKLVADDVQALREDKGPMRTDAFVSEAFANLTLAYRHLEDASMRLGKAVQALDGGVSVYDRAQVPA